VRGEGGDEGGVEEVEGEGVPLIECTAQGLVAIRNTVELQ